MARLLEEERLSPAEPELKEILVLVESGKSPNELTPDLAKITPQPKELKTTKK